MKGTDFAAKSAEFLGALDGARAALVQLVERLAAAKPVARQEVDQSLDGAIRSGAELRQLVENAAAFLMVDRPEWSGRAELSKTLEDLRTKLDDPRQRRVATHLLNMARELKHGKILEKVQARRRRLEELRSGALEAAEAADPVAVGERLKWPDSPEPSWVLWFLSLEDPDASEAHDALMEVLPVVGEFVTSLGLGNWTYDSAVAGSTSQVPSISPTTPLLVASPALVTKPAAVAKGTELAQPDQASQPSADGSSELVRSASADSDRKVLLEPVPRLVEPGVGGQANDCSCEQIRPSRPVTATPELPAELATYEAFSSSHWSDPSGTIDRAPWTQDDFRQKLGAEARKALVDRRFDYLVTLCRAAEQLALRGLPRLDDLRILLATLSSPGAPSADARPGRIDNIRKTSVDGTLVEDFGAQLALVVAALRANPSQALTLTEMEKVLEQVGLATTTIGHFLSELMHLATEEEFPLLRLREVHRRLPPRSAATLQSAVDDAVGELAKRKRELWNRAGGKIQRSHCSDAWDEFILKIVSTIDGVASGDIRDFAIIDRVTAIGSKIADRRSVKFGDRSAWDHGVEALVAAASAVVVARMEQEQPRRQKANPVLDMLHEAYKQLRAQHSTSDNLWVPVLMAVVENDDGRIVSTAIPVRDVFLHPGLLECIAPIACGVEVGQGSFDAWGLADPVGASAHLMLPPALDHFAAGSSLPDHLRRIGRSDLLRLLYSSSKPEGQRAQDSFDSVHLGQLQAVRSAQAQLVRLQQLAHPVSGSVAAAIAQADAITCRIGMRSDVQVRRDGAIVPDSTPAFRTEVRPQFIVSWMQDLEAFACERIEEAIPRLRFALENSSPTPERSAQFEQALRSQRLDDARALALGEHLSSAMHDERETLRRAAAEASYPGLFRSMGTTPDVAGLLRYWKEGISFHSHDEALRRLFVQFVFGDRVGSKFLLERKSETAFKTEGIRLLLQKDGPNPSFVPQLLSYREISVITAPKSPKHERFVQVTADKIASKASSANGGIVVLLIPGTPRQLREQLRAEIDKRASRGVVLVDDLDLVRLMNPGGQQPNTIMGLLEFMLEQQPRLSMVNPFDTREGQHTKTEMFVGRLEEAQKLAREARYSRIFSGRKLGKSALLRHVTDSYDGERLPSGNELRVEYVPIAGIDGENQVIDRIETALANHLAFVATLTKREPRARLVELATAFTASRPTSSLLIFLDEADMFVEAQIREYQARQREHSLTWTMRTEIEAPKDSMALPRIRFVFAGYRATHRSEGAWANWGDVLRLQPLHLEDARKLISGPLARIGANATTEAGSIAYRCGYQPAVLLKFGQRLIEHLDDTVTPARRSMIEVGPQDVASVYNAPDVQSEIRTIVWQNFNGNPLGKVVFAAVLLEFGRLAPGAPLEDAPARVLARLRQVVPGFMSKTSLAGGAEDRVAQQIRDLVDRSILRQVDATTHTYQMRFAHHLPILLQMDQEVTIRNEATNVDIEAASESLDAVCSLLSAVELDNLREAASEPDLCQVVVASSHFESLLVDDAASVAARLDYSADEQLDAATQRDDLGSRLTSGRMAVLHAMPKVAEEALHAARDGDCRRPLLVGGLDLLRWAVNARRSGGGCIEVAAIGRLSSVQLRWWIERVRCVEFVSSSSSKSILDATSGIPFLVGKLDEIFRKIVGFDGQSASDAQVEEVLRALADGVPAVARQLATKELERREAELFVLVAEASKIAMSTDDLRQILSDPAEYAGQLPLLESLAGLGADDDQHLELLLRSGLLPMNSNRSRPQSLDALIPLDPGDAAHQLARGMYECLSS